MLCLIYYEVVSLFWIYIFLVIDYYFYFRSVQCLLLFSRHTLSVRLAFLLLSVFCRLLVDFKFTFSLPFLSLLDLGLYLLCVRRSGSVSKLGRRWGGVAVAGRSALLAVVDVTDPKGYIVNILAVIEVINVLIVMSFSSSETALALYHSVENDIDNYGLLLQANALDVWRPFVYLDYIWMWLRFFCPCCDI